MSKLKISVVVPFYNTPVEYFSKCLQSLQKVNPYEVILVDDCSTNEQTVKLAIESGFKYLKTKKQSGRDGHPINVGMKAATGDYACRVDSDDELLALPKEMNTNICFGYQSRVKPAFDLCIEDIILDPRALCHATVCKKEIFLKHPFAEDTNVYCDVLFTLQVLLHKYSFTVYPEINYIYNKLEDSIITSKSLFSQRLINIQTVARFCEMENLEPNEAFRLLKLAMLNVQHGRESLGLFTQDQKA